ncbi:hypothetical protein J4422_02740 [Candidatus Pacearchaeota archaeon]|nr:hypothetical protein [Candidatus Pacearchaeota archaeon]
MPQSTFTPNAPKIVNWPMIILIGFGVIIISGVAFMLLFNKSDIRENTGIDRSSGVGSQSQFPGFGTGENQNNVEKSSSVLDPYLKNYGEKEVVSEQGSEQGNGGENVVETEDENTISSGTTTGTTGNLPSITTTPGDFNNSKLLMINSIPQEISCPVSFQGQTDYLGGPNAVLRILPSGWSYTSSGNKTGTGELVEDMVVTPQGTFPIWPNLPMVYSVFDPNKPPYLPAGSAVYTDNTIRWADGRLLRDFKAEGEAPMLLQNEKTSDDVMRQLNGQPLVIGPENINKESGIPDAVEKAFHQAGISQFSYIYEGVKHCFSPT